MSCPHSRAPGSRPETCSLCLGATPRKVVQVGAELLVDGVAVRPVEPRHDKLGPMTVGKRRRKQLHGEAWRAREGARRAVDALDEDGTPTPSGEGDE